MLSESHDGTLVYNQRAPDDWHVHLRQHIPWWRRESWRRDGLLPLVLSYTENQFSRALVMPNTKPPIITRRDVQTYLAAIKKFSQRDDFEPLLTIKITEETTPEIIKEAYDAGVIAGKAYPVGTTTHAEDGVTDFRSRLLSKILATMQELGMVLCLHGEAPGVYWLDRERVFLTTVAWLAQTFPKLRIVLEHITDRESVRLISSTENVWATVTLHHLILTTDDVVGNYCQPDLFCKPLAKRPEDREALRKAVFTGQEKIFFGSDSAPWRTEDKHCASGCAGIFSAPILMPALVMLFEEHRALEKLEDFTSTIGAHCYGQLRNSGAVRLIKKPWTVPESYHGIRPFLAGSSLTWQFEARSKMEHPRLI